MSGVSIGIEVEVKVKIKVVVGLQIKSIPHAAIIHCRCGSLLEEERRGKRAEGGGKGREKRGDDINC